MSAVLNRLVRRALNRPSFVFMLWAVFYVVGAFLYSLLEGVSLGDALWWAIVTVTTTGYGDMSPVTLLGRSMAGVYMYAMMILNAFIVAHILVAVFEDKNLFDHTEQEQSKLGIAAIGVHVGAFPKGSRSLPSLQWFREKNMDVQDNSS